MRPESSRSHNSLPTKLNESMSLPTLLNTGASSDIGYTKSGGNVNSTDLSSVQSIRFKVPLDPILTHVVDFSLEASNFTAV